MTQAVILNGHGRTAGPERPRFEPTVARQRRPLRALLLVMVAAGCAALFALMFSRAGDRQPVLVVSRTVPAGVAIAAEDLTVLRLSAEPRLRMIPASARERVLGRTANAALIAGTVLTEAHFGDRSGPRVGESIVAIQLKGPRGAPPSIRTGDRVQVVLLPAGADATRNDPLANQRLGSVVGEGRVLGVDRPRSTADNASTVSVIVPDALAPTVAGAAAAERVSLVVVGRGE